jgi:hypothetical protein
MIRQAVIPCVAAWAAVAAPAAHASVIRSFSETGNAGIVTATNDVSYATTLRVSNAAITVELIDASAPLATPFAALLNLFATSFTPATLSGGSIKQSFSCDFAITRGATNVLSGTFADTFTRRDSAAMLTASTPPIIDVTYTSDLIIPASLGNPLSFSLSIGEISPTLGLSHGTVAGFTGSLTGQFLANPTPIAAPEPASPLLLGAGLAGLGVVRRRRL